MNYVCHKVICKVKNPLLLKVLFDLATKKGIDNYESNTGTGYCCLYGDSILVGFGPFSCRIKYPEISFEEMLTRILNIKRKKGE